MFVLAALVPWTFFSVPWQPPRGAWSRRFRSSLRSFPWLIIPVAAAAAFLIISPSPSRFRSLSSRSLYFIRLALRVRSAVGGLRPPSALCFGIWLAALNVRYRDIIYTVPFLIQALMFASPIGYPSTLIPPRLARAVRAQPAHRADRGFSLGIRGLDGPPWSEVAVFLGMTIVLLIAGLVYFARSESSFADVI